MKRKIKVEIEEHDVNDDELEDMDSYSCPKCAKGIVTIGLVSEITFPEGVLCTEKYGKQIFYHYTCDKCNFKILVQDPDDIPKKDEDNKETEENEEDEITED